jgi:hypothetical protein
MKTLSQISASTVLLLIGFNRFDSLERRLNEIELNSPIDIYVSIDGPATTIEATKIEELLKLYSARKKDVNFDYRICRENMGLAFHIVDSIDTLFKEYSHVIVVEDDVMISTGFVGSMLQGFLRMEEDPSIGGIGGFSAFRKVLMSNEKNRWRRSKYFSAWGWGTNRRQWLNYNLELPPNYISELNHSSSWNALSEYQRKLWLSRFKKTAGQKPFTWDYQMQFDYFKRSVHMLLPTQRVSDNEGFENKLSTNTVGKRPKWMTRVSVSSNTPRERVKYFERIFELVDGITIGGDSRVFKFVKTPRGIFQKMSLPNLRSKRVD